jgi:prepilin signal peptidase PulO-like enzyme (type II secretory pathway)
LNGLAVGSGVVFLVGLVLGGQVNHAIYRLAWNPRWFSPWCPVPPQASARRPLDYVPVLGWWRLRRESSIHGRAFWIRPLLVEIGLAGLLAWLYRFEMTGGLFPALLRPAGDPFRLYFPVFLSHAVLICLMAVATFIDVDEKTIPDAITIPGAWAGMVLCALVPMSILPADSLPDGRLTRLWLSAPGAWPLWLDQTGGLGVGLACFAGWCYALLPKVWWTRSGMPRALRYLVASILRHPLSRWIGAMWMLGSLLIAVVWMAGGDGWRGLLTALAGLAYGGGIVWAVRVIATAVLRVEAMGFGDVTLLAMIGAFLGWQTSLIIFFVAPFAGALLAVIQWIATGRRDIAYGPFLCVATVVVIIGWAPIWFVYGQLYFAAGWLITAAVAVCLALMGLMLAAWRWISGR